MPLNNDKVMLIYGFNAEEREELQNMLKSNDLPGIKTIKSTMDNMKIRDIVQSLDVEIYDNTHDMTEEKVILFNNFADEEIEKAIDCIKTNYSFNPIYAVITPTSNNWTFKELVEHLTREREWYKSHNME